MELLYRILFSILIHVTLTSMTSRKVQMPKLHSHWIFLKTLIFQWPITHQISSFSHVMQKECFHQWQNSLLSKLIIILYLVIHAKLITKKQMTIFKLPKSNLMLVSENNILRCILTLMLKCFTNESKQIILMFGLLILDGHRENMAKEKEYRMKM